MRKWLKKQAKTLWSKISGIDRNDIQLVGGLALLWRGLHVWMGPEKAMTIIGGVLFGLAAFEIVIHTIRR